MNLANEKWLGQRIPPTKNCKRKKEEISDIHFHDIQMPGSIIQQIVTPVGRFEQIFDDDDDDDDYDDDDDAIAFK